ncbi:hypothetical protein C1H46_002976 [Malus baccata]|uniref:Uncharacterized protein n=1 Tax=Malus baccata TaxID=106549 RepID=A0A540NL91_MALBA|nr:hypothetical protein C1H46_002976 [Malus baccata]
MSQSAYIILTCFSQISSCPFLERYEYLADTSLHHFEMMIGTTKISSCPFLEHPERLANTTLQYSEKMTGRRKNSFWAFL